MNDTDNSNWPFITLNPAPMYRGNFNSLKAMTLEEDSRFLAAVNAALRPTTAISIPPVQAVQNVK